MAGRCAVLVVAACLAAAIAGGFSPGAVPAIRAPSVSGPPGRAVAREQAASLLASVTVPPGSASSSVEPPGGGRALAHPGAYPATPNLVDDHAWWVVPVKPSAAIAFIQAHPPAGSKLGFAGAGNTAPGFQLIGFDRGSVVHVLWSRSLVVEVVQLPDGDTGLRADAEVVWITPRAAGERIPAKATRLNVSVTRRPQVIQRSFDVTDTRRVRRVAALIDSLPAAQPGAFACPADPGVRVRLSFESATGEPLAVIAVDPGGCGVVTVRIRGRKRASLTSTPFPGSGRPPRASLVAQLDAALGVHLNTSRP